MILRNCALVSILILQVFGKPIQNNLNAVNTFLDTLASQDARTDSSVVIDYQNMASKENPSHDNAKNPLFTTVDKTVTSGPVYSAIATLVNLYQHDSETPQPVTPELQQAINTFLDQIIQTSALTQAWNFLQQQGVSSSDAANFRAQLYNLWFLPYARKSVVGSSGFKSVFVGEATGNTITRFSNWYGFYLQEQAENFNYHGWFARVKGVAISLQFVLGQELDLETAFILNSSPDFEFAAITVAALTSTEPTVSIEGNDVTIHVDVLNSSGNTVIDKVTISFGTHPSKSTKASKTTKRPNGNNAALQSAVDDMWAADKERPTSAQVEMNWGSHINKKTGSKNYPLFTKVDESLFKIDQYADLIETYDKNLFTPNVCTAEPSMSGFRKQYLQTVFDTFTASPMFSIAFKYLQTIGYKETSTLQNFKTNVLWPLWFGTYSRCKGALGSSGWEHVFSGEVKGTGVDGQHNWVRYYLQQKADKMVYEGYYSHDENLIGTFEYTWMGNLKPKGGFFTGTSPAFDFSLLTICALAHGNGGNCHFTINNQARTVTSYLQSCGSGTCLATAYPS